MSVIFILIPLSIVTAGVFLAGFIWAVRSGQYEDTCTPAMRLLSEDASTNKTTVKKGAAESAETKGEQILKSE